MYQTHINSWPAYVSEINFPKEFIHLLSFNYNLQATKAKSHLLLKGNLNESENI